MDYRPGWPPERQNRDRPLPALEQPLFIVPASLGRPSGPPARRHERAAADLGEAERRLVEIHTLPEVEHIDVVVGESESHGASRSMIPLPIISASILDTQTLAFLPGHFESGITPDSI